jgi:hypothetical protein
MMWLVFGLLPALAMLHIDKGSQDQISARLCEFEIAESSAGRDGEANNKPIG